MASPSPEQQSAARQMKQVKLNKSARRPNLQEIVTGVALLTAAATPMMADASSVRDVEAFQAAGQSDATFYLQNNDNGVTYDSAELKFDELLTPIAQAVKDRNSDYANASLSEIMAEWTFGLNSSAGDVYTGWSAALNGSVLDLSHNGGDPGLDYTVWSDLLNQNEAALTVDFKDQLDFNHNGSYDSLTEKLTWDGPLVTDAFTGIVDIDNKYSSDAKAVNVIPEPVTLGLMGLGGLLAIAARRLGDYGRPS